MVLMWRGWGIGVFFLFCFWMLAGILIAVLSDYHEPDPVKAGLTLQWGMAALTAAYALSVQALAYWRKTHPFMFEDPETGHVTPVRNIDDLYGIRLEYWPWILGALAALLAVLTAMGRIVF
jgi:hypothetical protein